MKSQKPYHLQSGAQHRQTAISQGWELRAWGAGGLGMGQRETRPHSAGAGSPEIFGPQLKPRNPTPNPVWGEGAKKQAGLSPALASLTLIYRCAAFQVSRCCGRAPASVAKSGWTARGCGGKPVLGTPPPTPCAGRRRKKRRVHPRQCQ